MLLSLPFALQTLISTFLWSPKFQPSNDFPALSFELRHHHGLTNTSRIIFSNLPPAQSLAAPAPQLTIPRTRMTVPRPSSQADFAAARTMSLQGMSMAKRLEWWEDDVPGPDLSSRNSFLQFAHMAFNAYYADNTTEWYGLEDRGWDKSSPHGWRPGDDGMRGHVFVSTDNSTVVIAIKGTSAGWLVGGGGPSTTKDKLNDNLLFSCCCARVGPTWSTVCGCHEGGYRCDQKCVQDSLVSQEDLFYPVGLNLYNNVSYMYPNADIWLTGHSLGGSLASLIGVTFGAPVVAFEAPAEKMAAARLHLPAPPSTQHITHLYHTADPIPMGTCTGVTSSCAIGGFALESRCHLGNVVQLDTVSKLGWSVDMRNHGIKVVIDRLLGPNSEWPEEELEDEDEDDGPGPHGFFVERWGWPRWGGKDKGGREGEPKRRTRQLPLAKPAADVEGVDGVCTDCFQWEFGDYRNTSGGRSQRG